MQSMAEYEFNHYGSGDINVYFGGEKPAKSTGGGLVMSLIGVGSAACLGGWMVIEALAYVAAHAVAIGGFFAASGVGTAAIYYRKRIAALLPSPNPPAPQQVAAAMPVPAIEAPPPAPASEVVEVMAVDEVTEELLRLTTAGHRLTPELVQAVESFIARKNG